MKRPARRRELAPQKELYLALALLLLGTALRLVGLAQYPPGLNQDEASIGYEAWSLLHYGVDRNGAAWPVLFQSWGSGQNVLYAYLSMPAVALFGLGVGSLRLTAGVFGSLSLFVLWRLARRCRGPVFGLWALLALAVNPWHLLLSRWALESNLLPFFLLLGLWLLSLSRERPGLLLAAAASFALGVYAYGTAFLFLPPFLLGASLCLWRRRRVGWRVYLAALGVFALLVFPIALCQLRSALGLGETKLLWLTLPQLTQGRQAETVSLSADNLRDLGRLLWTQSDGLVWNSAGPFGLLYGKPGMALAALGLGEVLLRLLRGRAEDGEVYLLLALAASVLAALCMEVNVNRVNALFLPLVYCQGAGLALLARLLDAMSLRAAKPALAAVAALAAALLTVFYVTRYARALAPAFQTGLGEAIAYAEAGQPEEIWLSWDVNMPYIYVLFYTQPPPEAFYGTVSYLNPDGAFRWATAFGKYRFGRTPPPDTLCVLPVEKAGEMELLAQFGGYAVVFSG